jgi:hypothetical protein
MDPIDGKPPSDGTVRTVTGLLSRTGPEVPPDLATATAPAPAPAPAPATRPVFADEPTELLPVLPPPAPTVTARAVIVYEPEPRRRWGLWVFTAIMVALTSGVVLGQAEAYQPGYRAVPTVQTEPVPPYAAAPEPFPSPSDQAAPVAAQPITAPLGASTEQRIEVTGAATLLQVRSADLGGVLYSVASLDGGTLPTVENTPGGPRITLAPTGTVRTEVLVNSAVRWTIRLAGGSTELGVDLRGGGLAGLELAGGATRAALDLPDPAGTAALRVTGAVSDLQIRTSPGVPVRLRLAKGAATATVDGTNRGRVKSGTTLTSRGWRSAANRYDIRTSARVGTVLVDRQPRPGDSRSR